MPGETGATVVTNSCVIFFHTRLRVRLPPGIPHALMGEGYMDNSGANRAAGTRGRARFGLSSVETRRFICTIRNGLATARPARVRAAPQDEVCQLLMVRSAATPPVSNHEARMKWLFEKLK